MPMMMPDFQQEHRTLLSYAPQSLPLKAGSDRFLYLFEANHASLPLYFALKCKHGYAHARDCFQPRRPSVKEHHLKTALALVSIVLGVIALILGVQLLWQIARLALLGVCLWVAWGLIGGKGLRLPSFSRKLRKPRSYKG